MLSRTGSKSRATTSAYLLVLLILCCSSALTAASTTSPSLLSEEKDSCVVSGLFQCDTSKCRCDFGEFQDIGLIFDFFFSVLGFLASFVIIINTLTTPEMREPPGDILFGFCIASAILCILWALQALLKIFPIFDTQPDGDLCLYFGFVDVGANSFIYAYNFAFFGYFYYLTRTSLKASSIPKFLPHLASIVGIVVYQTWVLWGADWEVRKIFGMSVSGQCHFKTSNSYMFLIAGIVFYIFWPIAMYRVTKKSLADCKKVKKARYSFLKDYLLFVACTSIVNVAIALSSLYVARNLEDMSGVKDEPTGHLIKLIGTLLRVLRPVVLVLVRLLDSSLRQHWEQTFWFPKLCCCLMRKNQSDREASLIPEVEREDLDGKKTFMTMMTFRTMHTRLQNSPYLYEIQQAIKVQALYSILTSIHCFWRISKRKMQNNFAVSTEGTKLNHKMVFQTEVVEIDDGILQTELPEMMKEIQKRNYKLIGGKLTVHAPALFGEIVQIDDASSKLVESLDLRKNYRRIRNAREGKGGKSGEFFFFSSDENLVIKTISDHELNTLLKILLNFVQHFRDNPGSLIAKIYGIYTFERKNPYEKYNLILMKNVCGYPSGAVMRKYDLKGSKYTRYTVPLDEERTINELRSLDLKDIDFDRFEKKIHIKQNLQAKLVKILRADAEFLRFNDLIDYSLVAYLVDKGSSDEESNDKALNSLNRKSSEEKVMSTSSFLRTDSSDDLEDEDPRFSRAKTMAAASFLHSPKKTQERLDSIKSTEEDLYYNIGIIDYLNKYTFKKRLEVFWKKFVNCNPNLELSAAHQDRYAERFAQYMEQIIKE